MPYQMNNLPDNIKKLSKEEQETWLKAFNAAYENYSKEDPKTAEARALAKANETIKTKEGEKCMMCDVMNSATSFEELETAEVVMEQSEKMEKLTYQTERLMSNVMRSEIEDKPSALSRIVDGLKSRLTGIMGSREKIDRTIFSVTKDKSGDYRWFALVSNIFRDADNPPEIFETKAHKEYVNYVDESGDYPEFWLWHVPGTKSGKADWIDFDDGFLMASGTFDNQEVAERLAKDKNLGVSHGFNYRYSNKEKGIIGWYRTFEISVLPKDKAANPWAGIEILKAEAKMDVKKRKFLVDKLGEDRVKELEARPAELSKALKDAGIEYKEVTEDFEEAVKAVTESKAYKSLVAALDDLKAQKEKDSKAIEDLQTLVAQIGEAIKELKKSDDEKIAETLSPRSTNLKRASESKDNILDPEKDKELGKAAPSWLEAAMGGIKSQN